MAVLWKHFMPKYVKRNAKTLEWRKSLCHSPSPQLNQGKDFFENQYKALEWMECPPTCERIELERASRKCLHSLAPAGLPPLSPLPDCSAGDCRLGRERVSARHHSQETRYDPIPDPGAHPALD